MKTICVIGLGYIGLPTASLLATRRFQVHGVDVRPQVVETINRGNIHIQEPDLDVMVMSAIQSGYLTASLTPAPADVFIIAVPTPFQEGHIPDLSYVEAATLSLAPHLAPGNLVVLESTSPVGTTEKIAQLLREQRPDLDVPLPDILSSEFPSTGASETMERDHPSIFIAHCPERVLPGKILTELVENDRIIGGINAASARVAQEFYSQFVHGKIFLTHARTAELAKLAENAYRDVNIAFANELSMICDRLKIDVWELIELANRHPRVNILRPGPGVGGHCIAVDPWFIVHSARDEAQLIRTARAVNENKTEHVLRSVKKAAAEGSGGSQPVIACLGLAFKADVDDLRESPALEIVRHLAQEGTGQILVVEPHIEALPPELADFAGIRLVDTETAMQQAEIIVLLVDHRHFASLDPLLLREKTVIDTRGLWSQTERAAGSATTRN